MSTDWISCDLRRVQSGLLLILMLPLRSNYKQIQISRYPLKLPNLIIYITYESN